MRSRGLWGLLLFVAAGCSGAWDGYVPTYDGYKAQLDGMVGQEINVAVAELGAPTRTVELALGSMLYVWEDMSELRTAQRGRVHSDPSNGDRTIVLSGGDRIPLDCVTEIETDANGLIVRTRAEGIACVGLAPGAARPVVPPMPIGDIPGVTPTSVPPPLPVAPPVVQPALTQQQMNAEGLRGPAIPGVTPEGEVQAAPEEPVVMERPARRRRRERRANRK